MAVCEIQVMRDTLGKGAKRGLYPLSVPVPANVVAEDYHRSILDWIEVTLEEPCTALRHGWTGLVWTERRGPKREETEPVSVFIFVCESSSDRQLLKGRFGGRSIRNLNYYFMENTDPGSFKAAKQEARWRRTARMLR